MTDQYRQSPSRFKADASEGAWSIRRPSVGQKLTACDELSHIKLLQGCSYDLFLLFSEPRVAKPAEQTIYTILFVLLPPRALSSGPRRRH